MRLWVPAAERRPSPAPVQTDDRKAFLVGTILWVIALAVVLLVAPGAFVWTCVAGLVIGAIGLAWSIWRHRTQ